ncbi:MAG: glycosyltransferase family 39 protein [Planctomycetota bacterium]
MPTPKPPSVTNEPRRLPAWGPLAVVVFGVVVLGANLGGGRVLTYHEAVITQPAREMVATGDWLVPTFGGVVFPDKPPLASWLVAGSALLFGGFDEAVVRFPAVLAAVVAAVTVAVLGAELCGRTVGLVAGFVQLTSYWTLMQGRLAEPDMPLCACVTVAMAAFCRGVIFRTDPDEPFSPRAKVTFLAASGLAFLAKGPIALAFIGGGIGLYVVLTRRWSTAGFLLSPVGWAVFLAATVGWPAGAYFSRPEIFDGWLTHNLGRFGGDLPGEQDPWTYATALPLLLLPWLPFTIGGGVSVVRTVGGEHSTRREAWKFFACWTMFGLCLLQAAAFKHKHYLLPVLPPLSLLSASGLVAWSRVTWRTSFVPGLLATSIVGAVVAVCLTSEELRPGLGVAVATPLSIVAVGGTAALFAGRFGAWRWHLGLGLGTAAAVAAAVQTQVLPRFDSYRDQAVFAGRVGRLVPEGRAVSVVGLPESQIMCYLPVDSPRVDDPEAFRKVLDEADRDDGEAPSVYSVMPRRLAEDFIADGGGRVLDRCDSVRKREAEGDRLTLVGFFGPANGPLVTSGADTPARLPPRPLRVVAAPELLTPPGSAIR